MRFSAEIAPLRNAVNMAVKAVAARNVIPILDCLLISAADGEVRATGSNLDLYIVGRSDAAVPEGGKACVSARALQAFLAAAPKDALVSVETEGDRMTIKAGRASIALKISPDAFPNVVKPDTSHEVTCVKAVRMAAAFPNPNDIARPQYMGVNTVNGGVFAGMGHIAMAHVGGCDFVTHIPVGAVALLEDDDRLFVGETWWVAERENVRMFGKTFEEKPGPNVWDYLTSPAAVEFGFVNADSLAEALSIVASADAGQRPATNAAVVKISDSSIDISRAGSNGDATASVVFDGAADVTFGINLADLLKIAKSASGRVLSVGATAELSTPSAAIRIRDREYIWSIMPMRV